VEELTREANEQANLKHQVEQEFKRAREPLKGMERNLKHLKKEKASAERALQNANQRLDEKRQEIVARAGSAESEAAKRAQRLQEAEAQLPEMKEKLDRRKQDLNDMRQAYEELEPHVGQAKTNVNDTTKKLRAIESRIGSLESSSGNSLAMFGQRCTQLKKAVDDCANKRRFQGPVCGPIGAYLKIAPGKEQFASLAEHAMGNGVLDRFIVTNDHDRKLMQSLRQKVGCQADCGLFQVSAHAGRYKVPGPPVEGIETIESILNVSDDLVFNCLVDNCKIEENALSRSKDESEQKLLVDEGRRLSLRGKIKKVFFLPKGDNWSVKGGAKQMVANERGQLRQSIGLDKSKALEEAKRDVVSVQNELSVLRREEGRLEHEHREKQKAWTKGKKDAMGLKASINAIVEKIDSIKNEQDTAEHFDTDTSDLEQDVENAQSDLDVLKGRETALQEEISTKEPEVQELKDRVEEVATRNMKVIKEMEEASSALAAYMNSLSQRDEKLDKKRKKLQQLQEIVDQQEAKIGEITNDVKNYLKGSRLLAYARLKRDEEEAEDTLDVDASQFSQNPSDEELEAIGINDVEKDPNYYRAKVDKLNKKIEQEKERRNANKEDAMAAFEKYKRAKDIHDGKKAQLNEIEGMKRSLTNDVRKRRVRWEQFRGHIAEKTSVAFDEILNRKGSSGTVEFDHENKALDLIVQKDSADANSQQKDVKALSGGERSYTTIALLLALGESLETPFRILDEFDVFLDPVARKLTINSLIEMAKSMPHRQFVFITPQDVSNVTTDPMLKVFKMTPPARTSVAGGPTQQTLEFSQA
jgi:chromosome segregation ATPase